MLDRGYNIAHVREMLSAWEEGKDLGDVLGLETAIVGTWTTEKSQTMPLAEAQRLINDIKAFDRLVQLQVIHLDDGQATITRPKLVEAFNEIRGYGMEMDKLIDLHEHSLKRDYLWWTIRSPRRPGSLALRVLPGACRCREPDR